MAPMPKDKLQVMILAKLRHGPKTAMGDPLGIDCFNDRTTWMTAMKQIVMFKTTLIIVLMLIGCSAHIPIPQEPWVEGQTLTLEQTARWAQVDWANRHKDSLESVTIIEAHPVVWSDGSLGCPRPDGMYTQALVEGYLVIVNSEAGRAAYHAALGRAPFHCPEDRRQPPILRGETIY